jgi:hypothetical protein
MTILWVFLVPNTDMFLKVDRVRGPVPYPENVRKVLENAENEPRFTSRPPRTIYFNNGYNRRGYNQLQL